MPKYKQWLSHEGLVRIEGWARDGLTDEQIAHNMGISRSTLNDWKNKFSDISDTLKRGKEVIDREVENSLLNRASGMVVVDKQYKMVHIDDDILKVKRKMFENEWKLDHPEATLKECKEAAIQNVPEYKRIKIFETHHELPPDTTAAMFWLKNRKPNEYRDKSFQDLNKAQSEKALADVRKASAEADIAEYKAKDLKGEGYDNPILDGLMEAAQKLKPKETDNEK